MGEDGFDCVFAKGENKGSDQCLHWSQQHPTGVLHCYGFESVCTLHIEKVQHHKVLDFFWWGRTDSNHRSDTQQIYSLSPLATRELPHI